MTGRPRNPDDLLKWSIAASNQGTGNADASSGSDTIQGVAGQIAAGQRPDLADPGLYEALMGKSEAQMMREELNVALDTSRSEQDRVQALDNFEMLIEQIDNANNMTNMKMWQPLIALLDAPSSSPSIQLAALWIIGTAVQNNDKAQMAILDFHPLKHVVQLLVHSPDAGVRSKALYALSGILKHNAKAVQLFAQDDGFAALRGALLDPDVSLRRKAAFLVNTLLLQDDDGDKDAEPETSVRGSTAIAPMPGADADRPPMPLEQPPATQLAGVRQPAIAPILVSSRLLDTLVVSLLPASAQASLPSTLLDGIDTAASAGPDGDIELRDDLDYAEKASRACLTFAEKADRSLRGQVKTLLAALVAELHAKPVEKDVGADTRWQELGLTKEEVDALDAAVQNV